MFFFKKYKHILILQNPITTVMWFDTDLPTLFQIWKATLKHFNW